MFINAVGLCVSSPFPRPVMKFDKIESPSKSPTKGSPSHIIDGICIICRQQSWTLFSFVFNYAKHFETALPIINHLQLSSSLALPTTFYTLMSRPGLAAKLLNS
jgi:hypothetical protein